MRYLLTIMIVSLLSCDKDSVNDTTNDNPPTVTKVEVSSEIISGVARPKFTITLNVPEPGITSQLEVYRNAGFPTSKAAGKVVGPNSGQYVVIDSSATYPPVASVKYFAFFTMKNYSYLSYYPFEVK